MRNIILVSLVISVALALAGCYSTGTSDDMGQRFRNAGDFRLLIQARPDGSDENTVHDHWSIDQLHYLLMFMTSRYSLALCTLSKEHLSLRLQES